MSLEDAKRRLQENQDKLQAEQGRRDQAYVEQNEVENELSRMVADAVRDSIYSQDENINQFKRELHTTNENYRLLHSDIVKLNDMLADTTHLQEIYDLKERELVKRYNQREDELTARYNKKKEALDSRVEAARIETSQIEAKYIDRKKKLKEQAYDEEAELNRRIYAAKNKWKVIAGALIASFIVAIILGIIIGVYLVQNGVIQVDTPTAPF